ncbi:hypothetical protein [Micromonospora sp. NPDC047730]|uniref:hypothetical protein n=1 Tax=Micromonospora sp. NPDC047730 TaxID=3364253 RepID=UPI00371A1026
MAERFGPLNAAQERTLEHYEALGSVQTWYAGRVRDDDSVEVVGLGEDFIWALVIEHDGEVATYEAHIDPKTWQTGITC